MDTSFSHLSTAKAELLRQHRREALDWLLGRINYERNAVFPYHERQLKLDRMRQLLTRLGSPDVGQRIVHIAGTKGKGSTAAMVASMFTASGYRTGVYSSPHLDRIEQRFAIDGQACSAEQLVALVDRIRPIVEQMDDEVEATEEAALGGPTFFDVATAIAFLHFADQQVDVTILEVGLGGRLDSTNVCSPLVTAITCIGRDHMKQLGDTLEAIASEKAGIIKPGVPVVCAETGAGPQKVIAKVAREHGCRLIQKGQDFGVTAHEGGGGSFAIWRRVAEGEEELTDVRLRLLGRHQWENAAAATAIIGELADQGWSLPVDARRYGLQSASLPARVEWFPGQPAAVVDVAHNPASARALVAALEPLASFQGRTLVLAVSRDKEVAEIVNALTPSFDRFVLTRYQENPRAVPVEELAKLVQQATAGRIAAECIEVRETPREAWQRAVDITPSNGLIVVTGSFFIAAELRTLVASEAG